VLASARCWNDSSRACANALLFNGLGGYAEALAPAQRARAQDDLSLYPQLGGGDRDDLEAGVAQAGLVSTLRS
jgi:hypothetical protein